ncbi:MAG: MFS transporter [Candidatus Thermoplasmatota archaeon]|nr:MFS transporter [Candidatus Thermoplasmatota archaeon]MBU1940238.1 MFS transporter [Candidatus Thermoplasmatota archaeon]
MGRPSFFTGFTRNLILVGIVSLFTDLSSQMVFPLIPLYLVTLGASAWIIGLVEGAAETTASLLKVFSGYWSDIIKQRKPFVLTGYSLSTIAKPLFALATSWPFILFVRIFERVGKGIRTAPRDAIIAESVDSSIRGKAYGFHRALDGIGSISGAILAFLLLPILGFTNIFLLAVLPGLIAVFCIVFIKEKKIPNREKRVKTTSFKVSLKALPYNLKLFIFVSSVFTFGHLGYAFILLKARTIGLSNDTALLLYIIFYLVYTLSVIPSGIFSDKIGRKPVLILGYMLFAVTAISLIFTSQIYTLLIVFIIYGLFFAMVDGVQRAFVVDLSPPELKATALGTFHTAIGLVALPGGLLAGIIWDTISPEATFVFALVLTLCALLLFMFVKNNGK